MEFALKIAGACVVGAVLGSYLSTAAMRYVDGRSAMSGRSACDSCGIQLSFAATIPLASYLWRGGRCTSCREAINPVHPASELIGAVSATAVIMINAPLRASLVGILLALLLVISVIDLRTLRLPNALNYAITVVTAALLVTGAAPWWTGVLAAFVASGSLQLLRVLNVRRGRDPGLGFGDVKLVAGLALWLGVWTPWMIVLASALGLVWVGLRRGKDRLIPFGPMIGAAAAVLGVSAELGLIAR